MIVEKAAVRKREEEEGGRRSGKARVTGQPVSMKERVSTLLSICLSDP